MTSTATVPTTSAATGGYPVSRWAQWHADRERDLAAEHGWLSLTGFAWLTSEPSPVPGLPGLWAADDSDPDTTAAVVTASADDGLVVLGQPAGRSSAVGSRVATVAEQASLLWIGTPDGAVVELVRRGGRGALRIRDPHAPARTRFTGVPVFPLDPGWVRPAVVRPLPEPRTLEVATARPELRQRVTVAAEVDVILPDGDVVTLLAARGADGGPVITFHDAGNGDATARWRSVSAPAPDADGRTEVDFNRAVNMPFAFSDHGTCPAPPEGNVIGVAVTAGERRPLPVDAG